MASESQAATKLEGFPARANGRALAKGVTLADLDGDKKSEVIAAIGEGFTVVGADGKMWSGYPKVLRETKDTSTNHFDNAPTVCDVDGDGRLDIVLAGTNRRLYALRPDGTYLSGFPVSLDGEPKGAVSCSPRGSGKVHDLVLTTDNGSLLSIGSRGGKAKRLARIGKGAESGVAVSDLDGDGAMDYVVVGGDSQVYVVKNNGKIDPKVTYRMDFRVSGTPSLGDIDDDGRAEIVLASQDFKIHAIRLDGTAVEGFPYSTGYRLYGGAALVDVNRDGVLDVVVGSGDRKVHAVSGDGKTLKGFPTKIDGRISAEITAGDVDFDGRPEIAVVTERGSLFMIDSRGKVLSGYPVALGGEKTVTAPAFGDVDGDGAPELVAQGGSGAIFAFKFRRKGKAETAVLDWSMSGHNAGASGRYGPNPGRFKDLGFSKELIFTTDPVEAAYTFFDLDGDPEGKTRVRWFRDGKRVGSADDKRVVPSEVTKKHERWSYTVQDARNFESYGEDGMLAQVFRSPEVEIQNTPPSAPAIKLGPDGAQTSSPLSVSIITPSTDIDGDAIRYRYSWIRDGNPEKALNGKQEVAASRTKKGEIWRVVVAPYDGEVEGASNNATLTIKNTVPSAPEIAWSVATPKVDDSIQVQVKKAARDVDGDKIAYRYVYRVAGRELALPVTSDSIPPRTLHKHDALEVVVTAWDDEGPGGSSKLTLEVMNTPPEPPKHAIWPPTPKTSDPLTVGVRTQPADADRDAITLDYQWYRNGQPIELPSVVPADSTRKGEKWTVKVTPKDSESAGRTVEASTVIVNTPPEPPVLVLDSYVVNTATAIQPRIAREAVDADGDSVALRFGWFLEGKPTRNSGNSLPASVTRKGQRWEAVVTPNDGADDGKATRLAFAIKNSLPSAPKVSFTNSTPTVRETSEVRIDKSSEDPDGDKLEYRFRWYRNGVPVQGWLETKNSLKPDEANKGDRLRVEVVAFDGEGEGEVGQAELLVENHAPLPPKIRVTRQAEESRKVAARGRSPRPKPLQTVDNLQCALSEPAVDPDDDPLSYHYRWLRSEKAVPTAADLDVLPATMTVESETWSCEVRAFDGRSYSSAVRSAPVVLANAGPGAPKVSVFPPKPKTDDDLVCELTDPAPDPDYEPLRYTYRWKLNGRSRRDIDGNVVSAKTTQRGQTWQCEVVASDEKLSGPASMAEAVIANSSPSAPVVDISTPAFGAEPLRCEIRDPSKDVDGDKVRYRYRWLKDGVAQSFAPESREVPGRLVRKGDLWKCEVVASDGKADAPSSPSPAVLVQAARVAKSEAPESRGQKRSRRRRRR
ncbi:MAG: FG-GAP-like repeat-containing protein [Myxococcota bacterium]